MASIQIHVGDIGTKYRAKITDNSNPYDPSLAVTKDLLFKLPNDVILTRGATVTTDGTFWYFEYVTLAADLVAGLHAESGTYEWQAIMIFGDGTTFSTNVEKYIVYPNVN